MIVLIAFVLLKLFQIGPFTDLSWYWASAAGMMDFIHLCVLEEIFK